MKCFSSVRLIALLFAGVCLFAGSARAQLSLPLARQVFQRNQAGSAYVPITGQCPSGTTRIEAKATVVQGGTAQDWATVVSPVSGTSFAGRLLLAGGWYGLQVRAMNGSTVLATWTLDRVGVGEVFVIVGHSVASGNPTPTIPVSTDDRVNAIPRHPDQPTREQYNVNPVQALMPTQWAQYGNILPAPFGEVPYFWSACGEKLATALNVPIAFYQAAFGGTNCQMWYQSSQGIQFSHGFVRSDLRMPYINLKNTLLVYGRVTGVRGMLIDHGANDWTNTNVDEVVGYYNGFLAQARADAGFPVRALINRATPFPTTNPKPHIRKVQETVAAATYNYPGPDYDTGLQPSDRIDDVHLSASGLTKAAGLWSAAIQASFVPNAEPMLPVTTNGVSATTPDSTPTPPVTSTGLPVLTYAADTKTLTVTGSLDGAAKNAMQLRSGTGATVTGLYDNRVGSSCAFTTTLTLAPGTYYVIVYEPGNDARRAQSNTITVASATVTPPAPVTPPVTPTPDPIQTPPATSSGLPVLSYAVGTKTLTVTGTLDGAAKNAMQLYAGNGATVAGLYDNRVGTSCAFTTTLTLAPGTYYVIVYEPGNDARRAKSNTITVAAAAAQSQPTQAAMSARMGSGGTETVSAAPPTSDAAYPLDDAVRIFPVPTTGVISVRYPVSALPGLVGSARVLIVNSVGGQQLLTGTSREPGLLEVVVDTLPPGVYLLRLLDADGLPLRTAGSGGAIRFLKK